ncbi:response regulator [Nodosilinea sp. LEGE 07298]|uniref:response regulator n=1 Tax=Nodosilinea sp. LEGE 07298 TaxID=2777970 RepID=UPI0018830958|nr:response regulator [Nodosilinea sp. LEGE 07298]MBE9110659.1 response regulator [Nodosilinea sp. LEGE 07298]
MKILLLEDDPPTSEFLADTLTTHRYAVDAIADGATGLDLASRWPYDLLIVDWLLPSLDGLEVCRRLRAQGSLTPILMLTVKATSDDIVAGLDAGADDYLSKSCDAAQLLARVRALLRRSGTASPVLSWGKLCLDPALTQVTYDQQPVPCRPKEYELLELFLRSPQRLLTRSAIIDHLWPMADTPVEGSVTNLIKDLRQRLKAAGLAGSPIETVYGLGYRLKGAPQAAPEPNGSPAETDVSPAEADDVSPPSPRLDQVMQRATQRFRASLEQRLGVLDKAIQALETDTLSPQQRQLATTEAHQLAGGLGLFGYAQASEVAEAIEGLLRSATYAQLQAQLAHQVELLKRSLVISVSEEEIAVGHNSP